MIGMLRHTFEIASTEKKTTLEDALKSMAKVLNLKNKLRQT
jgi:hypothetical protein